jgi:hypothetical protein
MLVNQSYYLIYSHSAPPTGQNSPQIGQTDGHHGDDYFGQSQSWDLQGNAVKVGKPITRLRFAGKCGQNYDYRFSS